MKRLGQVLAVIFVLILIGLGALYFAASKYLTPERVKAYLVPPLEEATGLKVELGAVAREGFSGVRVTELRFISPETGKEVFSVEEMHLSLKLSPLLKGELLVSQATFLRPRLSLVRERDGKLNLEKLILKEKARPQEKAPRPSRLAFIFQDVQIKEARISFRDELKRLPPAEANFSLTARLSLAGGKLGLGAEGLLDLSVAGYPLVQGLRFEASGEGERLTLRLKGGNILSGRPEGEFLVGEESFDGAFSLKGASFEEGERFSTRLKPYLFPEAKIPSMSGHFDLSAKTAVREEKGFYYHLVLSLKPLKTQVETYKIFATGTLEATPETLTPKLNLTINDQELTLKGKVLLAQSPPRADLELSSPHLDLLALTKAGPKAEGSKKETETKNPPLILPLSGKIRFVGQEVCYRVCAKEVKTTLLLSPRKLTLKDLSLLLAGGIVQAQGRAALAEPPKVRLAYSVAGAELPLLLKAFLPESDLLTSGRIWSEGTFWGRGLEVESLKKTLNGQGQARFLDLGFKETLLTKLVATLLEMPALKNPSFEKGKIFFTVKEGLADVKGKLSREGLVVLLLGKIGLDGRLNLKPHLIFTGELAEAFKRRFPGASLFRTEKGYEVTVSVTGTVEEPKVSLVQGVKEKLKEKAKKEFFKFLSP